MVDGLVGEKCRPSPYWIMIHSLAALPVRIDLPAEFLGLRLS